MVPPLTYTYRFLLTFIDYIPSGDRSSSSHRNNLRISTQSPTFQKPIILPPTNLNLGQWYSANIAPLSFWRARLTVQQSSQNYEMNLTFVGNSSPMGINEKVRCKYLDQIMILLVSFEFSDA